MKREAIGASVVAGRMRSKRVAEHRNLLHFGAFQSESRIPYPLPMG